MFAGQMVPQIRLFWTQNLFEILLVNYFADLTYNSFLPLVSPSVKWT